jgi:hypothetical protein
LILHLIFINSTCKGVARYLCLVKNKFFIKKKPEGTFCRQAGKWGDNPGWGDGLLSPSVCGACFLNFNHCKHDSHPDLGCAVFRHFPRGVQHLSSFHLSNWLFSGFAIVTEAQSMDLCSLFPRRVYQRLTFLKALVGGAAFLIIRTILHP